MGCQSNSQEDAVVTSIPYVAPSIEYTYGNNSTNLSSAGSGDYEAEVEYYNPNTGIYSTYTLTVNVEDGELTHIYFPNGGWLDDSHFIPIDITDGEARFTTDKGYRFTVRLLDDIDSEDSESDSQSSNTEETDTDDEEDLEDENDDN